MRRIDYRHYICIAVTLGFALLGAFIYRDSYLRLAEAGRDFGLSVGFYGCYLLYIWGVRLRDIVMPTVQNLPRAPEAPPDVLPGPGPTPPADTVPPVSPDSGFDDFTGRTSGYWERLVSADNLRGYLNMLADNLPKVLSVVLMLAMIFVIVAVLFRMAYLHGNNDYNCDTVPLRAAKLYARIIYIPVRDWVTGFARFLGDNRIYIKLWAVIWVFNLNLVSVVLAFFAFVFYLIPSWDWGNIPVQIYKLTLDLRAFFGVPWYVLLPAGLLLLDRFRKRIAYGKLNHMEMKNRGFINARPIVSMICGSMGTGKTTMMTDMALSVTAMFRDTAFEKILETDLKFPYFPWINLENDLKRAMKYHQIYNLATCKIFVRKKREQWVKHSVRDKIFDYDYRRYGLEYDDKLKTENVWDIIETYAQLYFVYVIQSSLLVSNFSVRTDAIISDLGNFPLWNTDFFRRDSRLMDAYSRHAHIIDFDALRLGRKLTDDNRNKDFFEFGVVTITEIGKERGNNLELTGVKKKSEETNQKNDLFNAWLKMIRHSATIDNYPFVKVLTDEQRPTSWGADARDLCEIVYVREKSERKLAMPFFLFGELLHALLFGRFADLYRDYRYIRGDNCLFVYAIKSLTAKFHGYYAGIYNRFSYNVLSVGVESGTMDGNLSDGKYYLMAKKIYSKRFSTDCFAEYFTEKALRSCVGITDIPEYETERAAFTELQAQNSYFINELADIENNSREDISHGKK